MLNLPLRAFRERWIGAGATLQKNLRFLNPTENYGMSRSTSEKTITLVLIKGCLSTNLIFSALHLQGPKSNIHICALPLNK